MGTKNNPGPYDCYSSAEPDEPLFVLLARDPLAPFLVDLWAILRAEMDSDPVSGLKCQEARECARSMQKWPLSEEKRKRGLEAIRAVFGPWP